MLKKFPKDIDYNIFVNRFYAQRIFKGLKGDLPYLHAKYSLTVQGKSFDKCSIRLLELNCNQILLNWFNGYGKLSRFNKNNTKNIIVLYKLKSLLHNCKAFFSLSLVEHKLLVVTIILKYLIFLILSFNINTQFLCKGGSSGLQPVNSFSTLKKKNFGLLSVNRSPFINKKAQSQYNKQQFTFNKTIIFLLDCSALNLLLLKNFLAGFNKMEAVDSTIIFKLKKILYVV